LTAQACPDGSFVNAEIQLSGGVYYLIRENCEPVSPPTPVTVEADSSGAEVGYAGRTFTYSGN
jgi:hypothetical protein